MMSPQQTCVALDNSTSKATSSPVRGEDLSARTVMRIPFETPDQDVWPGANGTSTPVVSTGPKLVRVERTGSEPGATRVVEGGDPPGPLGRLDNVDVVVAGRGRVIAGVDGEGVDGNVAV
jgi:hypothetical protein